MSRSLSFFVAFAFALLGTGSVTLAEEPAHPTASITIAGVGEVASAPDMATLDAGVTTEAETAALALQSNNAVMERVFRALEERGIASEDVRTAHFAVHPQYAERTSRTAPPQIVGYRVSNRVQVRVRQLDQLGALLDLLVTEGANELGGIHFSLADPTALRDEARKRALADARRKAELYARGAGFTLGRVLRLEEQGAAMPLGPRTARLEVAGAVPVSPGELELRASIIVTYAIAE